MFPLLPKACALALATAALIQHAFAAPSGSLVNPNSNSDAKALMALLMKNYNSKLVLSGQQDTESANWIQSNIGKSPAVLGLDFMDYSPSRIAYGSSSNNVEQAITWAGKGGIVAFVWHWGSPSGTYNSASEPWYSNFYTAATSFDISAAMNNPSGNDYKLIVRDIDAIATQLKRLQSAGIPVLWRPLHEAEGGWFWWGAKGAAPCKALYALMYDRMTNYHGLNNLIWVWNSIATSWYPGNSVVDIVSADAYNSAGNHDVKANNYNSLKSLCGDTKLIAYAECGPIPDPAQMVSQGINWSYWMTWNGAFINDGNYNSKSFLQSTFGAASVVTLDELGSWKSGGSGTTNPVTTVAGGGGTTTTPPSTGGGSGGALYSQCGGIGWTGATTCASGTCKVSNAYYSQCL